MVEMFKNTRKSEISSSFNGFGNGPNKVSSSLKLFITFLSDHKINLLTNHTSCTYIVYELIAHNLKIQRNRRATVKTSEVYEEKTEHFHNKNRFIVQKRVFFYNISLNTDHLYRNFSYAVVETIHTVRTPNVKIIRFYCVHRFFYYERLNIFYSLFHS